MFEVWISTFGCANKSLVDNGVEFDNGHFLSFCDNLNIHILY